MKIDKPTQKLIDRMVKDSLNSTGYPQAKRIKVFTKELSKLSRPKAIAALTGFSKTLKREIGKTILEVETAIPLSQTQVNKLTNTSKVNYLISEVKIKVNPDLLGGLKVKIGDSVFDNSVLGKIELLKEEIRG